MRTTLITLLVLAAHASLAIPIHPYVGYDFFETRHTASDQRECITQIFLTADDYVGYRYSENILGSITPTVQAVAFSNEYRRKATVEEQARLVQELLGAKVFDLTSDSKSAPTDYFGNLYVRINRREARTYFYSRPDSPERKLIHQILLQFAKRMKVDRPKEAAQATTITEGDHQPARAVELADVLAHPELYHGKRISVIGFYHGEFEGNSLSVDEAAAREQLFSRSVWRSEASTFADKSAINDHNDSWLRVEGIFLRGPGGHLGLWPGELVRLTRIEPVSKPPL
jgi:hypothetical protein